MTAEFFGRTPHGRTATIYTLENRRFCVRITDYGGRMVSIEAPDRTGRLSDVLLGFDDVASYVGADGAFGALLGRNANRIAGGSFAVDGLRYQLPTNEGTSTLHGGPVGFDKVFWEVAAPADAPQGGAEAPLYPSRWRSGFSGRAHGSSHLLSR